MNTLSNPSPNGHVTQPQTIPAERRLHPEPAPTEGDGNVASNTPPHDPSEGLAALQAEAAYVETVSAPEKDQPNSKPPACANNAEGKSSIPSKQRKNQQVTNITTLASFGNNDYERATLTPVPLPNPPPLTQQTPAVPAPASGSESLTDSAGHPTDAELKRRAALRRLMARRNSYLRDLLRMATGRAPEGGEGDHRFRRCNLPEARLYLLTAIFRRHRLTNNLEWQDPEGFQSDGSLKLSWADLQTQAGASKGQVREGLRELEEGGIIERRRRRMNGKLGWASILYLRLNVQRLCELADQLPAWRRNR